MHRENIQMKSRSWKILSCLFERKENISSDKFALIYFILFYFAAESSVEQWVEQSSERSFYRISARYLRYILYVTVEKITF